MIRVNFEPPVLHRLALYLKELHLEALHLKELHLQGKYLEELHLEELCLEELHLEMPHLMALYLVAAPLPLRLLDRMAELMIPLLSPMEVKLQVCYWAENSLLIYLRQGLYFLPRLQGCRCLPQDQWEENQLPYIACPRLNSHPPDWSSPRRLFEQID